MSANTLEPSAGKRIALPVRVEPKVFFANERTFLSWLNFTVVLGGLAMGLLNFGDRIGRLSAVLFTVIAMGVMMYALYTFHWRATKIRNREAAPYDDRVGPTVLCIFLLAAVCINFYCKYFIEREKKRERECVCVCISIRLDRCGVLNCLYYYYSTNG
jgi:uncharacterized membrane protein YidH (DUF202 family)